MIQYDTASGGKAEIPAFKSFFHVHHKKKNPSKYSVTQTSKLTHCEASLTLLLVFVCLVFVYYFIFLAFKYSPRTQILPQLGFLETQTWAAPLRHWPQPSRRGTNSTTRWPTKRALFHRTFSQNQSFKHNPVLVFQLRISLLESARWGKLLTWKAPAQLLYLWKCLSGGV